MLKLILNRVIGLVLILLNISDAIYTKYLIDLNLADEINPIMKLLIDKIGLNNAMNLKIVVITFVILWLIRKMDEKIVRYGMYFLLVVYGLLNCYHLYTYFLLSSRGLL